MGQENFDYKFDLEFSTMNPKELAELDKRKIQDLINANPFEKSRESDLEILYLLSKVLKELAFKDWPEDAKNKPSMILSEEKFIVEAVKNIVENCLKPRMGKTKLDNPVSLELKLKSIIDKNNH